ncbi:cytokine receptor common subunit gamma isoform 2-T2 [Vipera latastei]
MELQWRLCLLGWGQGPPKVSATSGNPPPGQYPQGFHARNFPQETGGGGSDAFQPQIKFYHTHTHTHTPPLRGAVRTGASGAAALSSCWRMRVLDHPGSLLGLLLLLVAPGGEAAGSPQAKVDCICHNEDYVICEWGRQQKPVHNYSFYYWFENFSQPGECEKYRQIDGLNVACQLSEYEPFNYLKMYLNNSQDQNVVREAVLLNNRVRPGRPFNLTLHNLSNHQLLLTWDTPYKKAQCLQNAVRYKSNKDTQWMEYQVKSMEFQIPSVDPKKHYTFYVKSKLHDNCATTDLWSEESNPIFWGKEDVSPASLPFSLKDVAIPLGSIVLLLLLLGLLRMERVWVVLMPRIPKPSRMFEDLFTAYQGNFSDWSGVSKDMLESFRPSHYENICSITELLPSGDCLPASNKATIKTGELPDPLPDPPPKANLGPAAFAT